jgi:hypothetical protein
MKFLESDSGKAFVMSDKAGYDDEGKKIMKCKACGLAGHMLTNSNCPMYKNTKRVAGGGGGGGRGPELNRDMIHAQNPVVQEAVSAILGGSVIPLIVRGKCTTQRASCSCSKMVYAGSRTR